MKHGAVFFLTVVLVSLLACGCGEEAMEEVTEETEEATEVTASLPQNTVLAYVARDGLNRYYLYPARDLQESSLLNGQGMGGLLYRHFAGRKTVAVVDGEKGAVDYADVVKAYGSAVMAGEPFHLETYMAGEGKAFVLPPMLKRVTLDGWNLKEEEVLGFETPVAGEGLVERVTADRDGPLPVMTRVRWTAEPYREDCTYFWYIYRDGIHVRTMGGGENNSLDFVPTDPGIYEMRVFALSPEGYGSYSRSEGLVMEETVVIERPYLDFRKPLRLILDPVEVIIQHHMAHPTWDVFDVHHFHRNRIHWLDNTTWVKWLGIGYNYWIGFDGTIYEARGRFYGSHAGGNWNGRSLGVGFQGDFRYQEMTDRQVQSGAWLNAKLLIDEGLGIEAIWGHKQTSDTLCPGKKFRHEDLLEETARILAEVYGP